MGFLAWERKGRSKLYRTTTEFSEYFGLSVDAADPEAPARETRPHPQVADDRKA